MATGEQPTTLLILGAGGDLTKRLLLPGLASLFAVDRRRRVRVVGADLATLTPEQWRRRVEDAVKMIDAPAVVARRVSRRTAYRSTDLLDPESLRGLLDSVDQASLVIYFALPPSVTVKVCGLLAGMQLPQSTRLALEKPFGSDEESARELNEQLHQIVAEENVFRVDHFLGTNTVFNLVGLRFANRLLQPIWSAEHVERVEIVYDEDLALEGRAGYYDHAGALRDMLQSHLLQVMALFAMESVATLDAAEVQDQKVQALRATKLWGGSPKRSSRRARYTAGKIGRHKVPDYTAEHGVDPKRATETLAELTLQIDNNRWAGVPFMLRSGKALGSPRKQIVVHFRDVAHLPTGFVGAADHDRLVIDLKPGAVSLVLTMNAEGDPLDLEQKTMTAMLAPPRMRAYGEVLGDILDGSQLLTVRGDGAEDCWRIVDPVLAAWKAGRVPMQEYAAGTDGPDGW